MYKNFRLLIILLLLVASSFLLLSQQLKQSFVRINDTLITVVIADTVLKQTKGLSGRTGLPDNQGMLFIFPEQQIRNFWMEGMLFAIDIIWIKNNTVIGIEKNIPISKPRETNIPQYKSPQSVNFVLEVSAGFSDQAGFKIGDRVDFFL